VLTVRDVTAQHEMELQKERFLSAVAHDLRTPLTTIKGRVQMLERRARRGQFDQDSVAESLRRIDGGVTRMITLINELLDMANMEIGRPFRLSPRSTDLVALAAAAAREYQQVTSECRIEIQAPDAEVVGAWDPDRLDRVLANLLSNALKYSPDGTVVTVEVRRDGDWATLAVRDRGIGIPAADLPHIFDRFHRAGNVAGRIPGTGIGLAAVRQIVEQHGGSITAESVEGQGSCFTVRLPLNPQAAAPPPAH
jgi:signal transduction histidine kinase